MIQPGSLRQEVEQVLSVVTHSEGTPGERLSLGLCCHTPPACAHLPLALGGRDLQLGRVSSFSSLVLGCCRFGMWVGWPGSLWFWNASCPAMARSVSGYAIACSLLGQVHSSRGCSSLCGPEAGSCTPATPARSAGVVGGHGSALT